MIKLVEKKGTAKRSKQEEQKKRTRRLVNTSEKEK